MKAFINVYWGEDGNGNHGAYIGFETPDKTRLGGVLVEDVLPFECRGQACDPKEALDFFTLLGHWLTPPSFLKQAKAAARGATQDNPAKLSLPPVDLTHFGMIDDAGKLAPQRIRDIVAMVGKVWREDPQWGVLHALLARDDDLASIERLLMAVVRYRDVPKDDRWDFAKIMLPPESRSGGKLITEEHARLPLRWLKRGGGALKQDALLWTLNLRELGIIAPDGSLNPVAAKAASDFIWSHRDEEPDFARLREHLGGFQVRAVASREGQQQAEKSARERKLRHARKQAKVRRKRGRRR